MKKKHPISVDADLAQAGIALKRAAAKARKLSEQTGTPLYVMEGGRIVNANSQSANAYVLREDAGDRSRRR